MSAIAFGVPMQFDKAYAEGITQLTREDLRYAEELGYRIKLLGITRRARNGLELRVPHLAFQPDQLTDVPFLPMGDVETSYYLRMRVLDRPGVLADITRILADREISIDAMIQKEPTEGEDQTDIILLTHKSIEHRVVDAIARIESLPTVRGSVVRLRLEDLAKS